MNPELVAYIRTQTSAGVEIETIRKNLLANGWNEADINAAYAAAIQSPADTKEALLKISKWVAFVVFVTALAVGSYYLVFKKSEVINVETPLSAEEVTVPSRASTTPSVIPATQEVSTSTPAVSKAVDVSISPPSKSSFPDYYTLKDGVLTVNEGKFPKEIGEYKFRKVDTSYSTRERTASGETITHPAFAVSYAKGDPLIAGVFFVMGKKSPSDLQKLKEDPNVLQYPYKGMTFSCLTIAERLCVWETSEELNAASVFYITDGGGGKPVNHIIAKDGSEAEFLVLDWFLKEFPVK